MVWRGGDQQTKTPTLTHGRERALRAHLCVVGNVLVLLLAHNDGVLQVKVNQHHMLLVAGLQEGMLAEVRKAPKQP